MKQGIYELSSTPIYPIGKRYAPDERAFRYAQIYGVASIIGRAVCNWNTDEERALAAANSAIGSNTVTITVQSATGLVKDELKGGYVCYSPGFYHHRIKSHPAALSGATCVLTLETAIVGQAVDGTIWITAYHNLWHSVGSVPVPGEGAQSFVGWPFGAIATGQYTWVQTWGPVSGQPSIPFGLNANERKVYFNSDGSLTTPAGGVDTTAYQIAGFWIPNNWYGAARNAMLNSGHLFFLQIAP